MNINWLKDPNHLVCMTVDDFTDTFRRELACTDFKNQIREFQNDTRPGGKMILAGNRISIRIFRPNLSFSQELENGDDIWVSFGVNQPCYCMIGTAPKNEMACFFFSHKNCEYFPCHQTDKADSFNCLFCYCPLYYMGPLCGGNFEYMDSVKDCSNCMIPHQKNSYQYIHRRVWEIPPATLTLTTNAGR